MHADDIQTLASSEETLTRQIALVNTFAEEYLLKLNINKCEIVVFSRDRNFAPPLCEIEWSEMPAGDVGKCLGYWWKGDLLATKSVVENTKKAPRAFFHYGSIGVFQGDISPLSSKSVLECCLISVLLYGCENWILTEPLCQKLESLQSELVKQMLKWPKHLSNTVALATLDFPTMRSRVLQRKLSFLHRVINSSLFSLSGRTVFALSQDIDSLCLVKECRELEEGFGTHFNDNILARREVHLKNIKASIHDLNQQQGAAKCSVKAPIIAEVAKQVGWSKRWDVALNLGAKCQRTAMS